MLYILHPFGYFVNGLAWIYTRSVVDLCVCYSIAP
nr:MAG TPA: hypothetical protein [Caudoviricetes sp.]